MKCFHNKHLESFHGILKYIYMKGKENERMDKCIHANNFNHLVKLEKGKTTAKIMNNDIHRRHNFSLSLNVFSSFKVLAFCPLLFTWYTFFHKVILGIYLLCRALFVTLVDCWMCKQTRNDRYQVVLLSNQLRSNHNGYLL